MKKCENNIIRSVFMVISLSAVLNTSSILYAEQSKTYSDDDLTRYKSANDLHQTQINEYARITVDFRNANLFKVLKMISDVATKDGKKIIIDPNINDIITITEVNRPWIEILAVIVSRYNLKYDKQGDILYILSK